jgi:Kef-type K+ transport system membrane component KefB
MPPLDVPRFLGTLVIVFAAAKLLGALAKRLGQPAVLGELIAGILVGGSLLGIVDPNDPVMHILSEIGVVLLLFEIGLETDLNALLRVGGPAAVVACVGVVLPFALGYAVCELLGLGQNVAIVAGASLTATSVGITARVLSDLGRLRDPESQVILGAAVLDDILGLIILALVESMEAGKPLTFLEVVKVASLGFGFLIAALVIGRLVVPSFVRLVLKRPSAGTVTMTAVMLAFGLAWLADAAGSALIVGAFAAGLLLASTDIVRDAKRGVAHLGYFFVPLFFVMVGAAVDVRVLNPFDAANWPKLAFAALLIVVAALGKFLAGFAPFWFQGKKSVIGVGMIPRGEVGLIFAQKGLNSRVLNAGQYSALTLMVMVTTLMAPPLLRWLLPPQPLRPETQPSHEGIDELVNES